ncbi:MAG: ArnT family glycosyltransferase [Candidatus Hydrothermarchaeales archaeon]
MKKFDKHLIILIVIIFLASYSRLTNLTYPIWPDEALYAKVAENLYSGKGLTFHGNLFYYQPPFFILTVALSYVLLGISETSARIVGPLFGILGIIAVYYLGKYLYNEKVGIIAAFFLGVTPVHWFLSRMILTDIPLTTLITLAILFFYISTERDRRYTWVAGILVGLVCLTKRVGPIIYLILGSYLIASERNLNWIRRKELQTIFGISILLQISWEVIKFAVLKSFLGTPVRNIYSFSSKTQSVGVFTAKGVFIILKALPFTASKPVLLLVPLGIFFMIKRKKKEHILVTTPVLIFLFVLMSWYSYMLRHKFVAGVVPRILVPTVPFLCIISAYGLYELSTKVDRKQVYSFFIVSFILFTVVTNAYQGEDMIPEWNIYRGYSDVGRWIDQNTSEDSVLVSECRIIYYYSERNCIKYAPDAAGFQKSLEDTQDDIHLVIHSQNSISPSPPYVGDYIKEHQDFVHKVATFDTSYSSKAEIYR